MKSVTFFDTRDELLDLAGFFGYTSDDALRDAGFDLDNLEFGFVSEEEWTDGWWDGAATYYECWLLERMDYHGGSYRHTEYNGLHYYLVYKL